MKSLPRWYKGTVLVLVVAAIAMMAALTASGLRAVESETCVADVCCAGLDNNRGTQ